MRQHDHRGDFVSSVCTLSGSLGDDWGSRSVTRQLLRCGTGRGPAGWIIPGRREPSERRAVLSVQLARTAHGSVLMVRRGSDRFRAPSMPDTRPDQPSDVAFYLLRAQLVGRLLVNHPFLVPGSTRGRRQSAVCPVQSASSWISSRQEPYHPPARSRRRVRGGDQGEFVGVIRVPGCSGPRTRSRMGSRAASWSRAPATSPASPAQ